MKATLLDELTSFAQRESAPAILASTRKSENCWPGLWLPWNSVYFQLCFCDAAYPFDQRPPSASQCLHHNPEVLWKLVLIWGWTDLHLYRSCKLNKFKQHKRFFLMSPVMCQLSLVTYHPPAKCLTVGWFAKTKKGFLGGETNRQLRE